MKKTTKILIIFIFCTNYFLFAQNKLRETEKLKTTAKVWGFLKYYHPQVAEGKYEWDKQLFEILPKVKEASTKEQLSIVYVNWINALGNIKKCNTCKKKSNKEYFNKNFNLNWIKNSNIFSNELIKQLKYIIENRHQGNNNYISKDFESGSYKFTNELIHKDFNWKNKNLRLLTLFRYWNKIEYFFPYKYQTDTNWDDVLNRMIPKFLEPSSEVDFHLAMLELVVSIDDSHGYLRTKFTKKYFGNNFIPAGVKIINNKAVVNWFYSDSLSKINDLKIGDAITKINDVPINSIYKVKQKYAQGSNPNVKKAFFTHYSIFNGATDSVKIEYSRNNYLETKTIGRYPLKHFDFKKPEVEDFKIIESNIGYVNLGKIKVNDVPKMMDSLINTKAIIFDIRNYPKGTLYSIAKYISSKKNDFYKKIYPDLNYPGKYIWGKGNQCGENGELKYKGKVVLLVNELTQSHAEFTTMCLQTGDNVTTIGSQTSGADGNIIRFNMVGGYNTAISGLGIFYPDGTETQRKGVKIDIEIKPTIKGIKEGKDEVLEKAIKFIKS